MNKKVIFLVVILECILAIFVVSILGIAIEDARAEKLCTDIYFVDENGEKIPDGVIIEYELEKGSINYQLHWVLVAEDTTQKEIEFVSNNPFVTVDSTGRVTFLKDDASAEITIMAKDGSMKTDTIILVPKLKGGGNIDFMR